MLARYVVKQVHDEDLPGIAADALEAGYDSPTLRRLAGFEDMLDYLTLRRLLKQSLEELNITLPSYEQGAMIHARSIAREVLEGRLTPLQGAEHFARHFCEMEEFYVFVGLDDQYGFDEYNRESIIQNIIDEFRKLVAADEATDAAQ